jgi:uncharacterized protein YndB with AHSA1/START domain
MSGKTAITVESTIQAPLDRVWELWTSPGHITKWNSASDDWHTPLAENDLRVGGTFKSRMESRDGSQGFEFGGVYDEVELKQRIAYTMGDGRKVHISFSEAENGTHVSETFEAEESNSIDMQRGGWQAILDNFRKYAESNQS